MTVSLMYHLRNCRATRHCHNPLDARLEAKVAQWQEEDRCEREEEEWRLHGQRWDEDSMDIDDDESTVAEDFTDESRDVEGDLDLVKALKVCLGSQIVMASGLA
ncbi:hypothetical protein WOLCODRAFT_159086 [Wolfiporia cocos MD-104 SS10]|uniref:Uncharacterized protein n=1 Tax=Wolfiporia cocos (strain MD-104) TaxID=742152 RepID=A0A2H3JI27_WOLCO|nr:hypothetical protein WOLCODRAFT_159086 [Wolfiporia cocos MD-104 SS10]